VEARVATMLACSSLAAARTGITDMHARSGPQSGGAAEDHSRRGDRNELRPTERRLLSPEQAAAYLGLRSRFAVYRLVASGQLPALRLANKLRVDLRDLDVLIEKAKTNGAPRRDAFLANSRLPMVSAARLQDE
jgi:excisionase family DNA binding protein